MVRKTLRNNTVPKVLGAECLDGDIQDHITN